MQPTDAAALGVLVRDGGMLARRRRRCRTAADRARAPGASVRVVVPDRAERSLPPSLERGGAAMAAQRQSSFVTVSRAGLTLAAALGLARVFAGGVVVRARSRPRPLVPPAVFALGERRRWHPARGARPRSASSASWLAILVDDPSETVAGIPTSSALSQLGHDLAHAPHVLRSATVPVDPGRRGAGARRRRDVMSSRLATELIARRLDAPLGAIGPSIALFVAIAALGARTVGADDRVLRARRHRVPDRAAVRRGHRPGARGSNRGHPRRSQAVARRRSRSARSSSRSRSRSVPRFPGARGDALDQLPLARARPGHRAS